MLQLALEGGTDDFVDLRVRNLARAALMCVPVFIILLMVVRPLVFHQRVTFTIDLMSVFLFNNIVQFTAWWVITARAVCACVRRLHRNYAVSSAFQLLIPK